MAKTPEAARALLQSVWTPALARAAEEEASLQEIVAEEGGNFNVAPWDWRFYTEKRRKRLFDVDGGAFKPYLQLDRMIEAAFFAAGRLFGLSFIERFDIPLYHPDARSWAVLGRDGAPIALFIGDYFARPSKRGGAWMNAFRKQEKLDGAVLPIVVNVLNFARAGEGEATLLSLEDARTLFHEFGHALHGMLSNVAYPLIAGANVAPDFVEFPSQVYENWLEQPEMLRRFAVHARTGEPMPEPLMQKLLAARRFNQGFATVEYAASALVDLGLTPSPSAATSTSSPSRSRSLNGSKCRKRSPCATARRISNMSFPAAATRPATTAICGRRRSTPTPSRPSRRAAIFSLPTSPGGSMSMSIPRAIASIRRSPMRGSADVRPTPARCSAGAGSPNSERRARDAGSRPHATGRR